MSDIEGYIQAKDIEDDSRTQSSSSNASTSESNDVDISDSSFESPSPTSRSVSIQSEETISLSSDQKTIVSDGGSIGDTCKTSRIFLGQPDHPPSGNNSQNAEDEEFNIDFSRQKECSKLHVHRRSKFIKRYLEKMQLCDFSFCFGDKTIVPAHSVMFKIHEGFANKYPEFSEPVSGRASSLDVLQHITISAFRAVMDFVYDGECQVTYTDLKDVLAAIQFFGVNSLEQHIFAEIDESLKPEFLLAIVFQGDRDHPLHEHAWAKLLEEIGQIIRDRSYLALELGEICEILQSDGLAVATEYCVFEMGFCWINADLSRRSVHTIRVMSCVRFHYMTPEELTRCQRKEALFKSNRFLTDVVDLAYIARPFILDNNLDFLHHFKLVPPRNLEVLQHFVSFRDPVLHTLKNAEKDESFAYVRSPKTANVQRLSRSQKTIDRIKPVPSKIDKGSGLVPSLADYKNTVELPGSRMSSARTRTSDITFNDGGSLVTKNGGPVVHKTISRAFEKIYENKSRNNSETQK